MEIGVDECPSHKLGEWCGKDAANRGRNAFQCAGHQEGESFGMKRMKNGRNVKSRIYNEIWKKRIT